MANPAPVYTPFHQRGPGRPAGSPNAIPRLLQEGVVTAVLMLGLKVDKLPPDLFTFKEKDEARLACAQYYLDYPDDRSKCLQKITSRTVDVTLYEEPPPSEVKTLEELRRHAIQSGWDPDVLRHLADLIDEERAKKQQRHLGVTTIVLVSEEDVTNALEGLDQPTRSPGSRPCWRCQ